MAPSGDGKGDTEYVRAAGQVKNQRLLLCGIL